MTTIIETSRPVKDSIDNELVRDFHQSERFLSQQMGAHHIDLIKDKKLKKLFKKAHKQHFKLIEYIEKNYQDLVGKCANCAGTGKVDNSLF